MPGYQDHFNSTLLPIPFTNSHYGCSFVDWICRILQKSQISINTAESLTPCVLFEPFWRLPHVHSIKKWICLCKRGKYELQSLSPHRYVWNRLRGFCDYLIWTVGRSLMTMFKSNDHKNPRCLLYLKQFKSIHLIAIEVVWISSTCAAQIPGE